MIRMIKVPDLRGRVVWIFGKGPSLEGYLSKTAVRPRLDAQAVHLGINQVPEVVDCDYGFANDFPMVERMAGRWPIDCRPVLPRGGEGAYGLDPAAGRRGAEYRRALWYDATSIRTGGWDSDEFILGGERLRLVHWLGTPLTALQFARVCGCRDVVLAGIDGGGGYTLKWDNDCGADSAHAAIRDGIWEYALKWGLRVRDFNEADYE